MATQVPLVSSPSTACKAGAQDRQDETPIHSALPRGISSSLDANGLGNPEMNGFEKSEMAVF